jgi:UDP-2,3-diacylglucosamine pyrophosphatase LpxH
MGDAHIGSTKNLDIFLHEAVKSKAEAILMVGDITMGYAEDFETLKQHLPANDILPSFLIVGNHDLYFDGWKTYYSLFGSTTYYFSVKTPHATDLFICLDSGSGTLGSKQLGWLKELLDSKRSNYRRCVMFSHVNLFRVRHTLSGNPFVEELRVILQLCAKNQIDMVVSGHDHERNVVNFGNTTFVTMDLLQDDFKNSGYFKLFVRNGKIEFEFVNL